MRFKLFKNKEKLQNSQINSNKKTQEKSTGRSMVEMLGVLAIIGVLSIGGIQGYTIAMRRFRANEILNIAHKYALIIYTDLKNKMMDNPDKLYIDEEGRWIIRDFEIFGHSDLYNDTIPFEQAGLGSLPSGIIHMYPWRIVTNNSGDLVMIILDFENEQLCQAVFQILGTIPLSDTSYGQCETDVPNIFTHVTFIMN